MNIRNKPLSLLLATLAATIIAGCVSDPIHVEEDFGNSVNQMVNAQIYDPGTASDPDATAPEWLYGTAASNSVDGYDKSSRFENRSEGSSDDFDISFE